MATNHSKLKTRERAFTLAIPCAGLTPRTLTAYVPYNGVATSTTTTLHRYHTYLLANWIATLYDLVLLERIQLATDADASISKSSPTTHHGAGISARHTALRKSRGGCCTTADGNAHNERLCRTRRYNVVVLALCCNVNGLENTSDSRHCLAGCATVLDMLCFVHTS